MRFVRREIRLELASTRIPTRLQSAFTTRLGADGKRTNRGLGEILIEGPVHTVFNDIDRPRHRKGGDRHPTRHGLEIHETKRIREAGEHEDVRSGDMTRQLLPKLVSGIHSIGILLLQARQLRPIANDELGSLPWHAQEGILILLYSDAPDTHRDRT